MFSSIVNDNDEDLMGFSRKKSTPVSNVIGDQIPELNPGECFRDETKGFCRFDKYHTQQYKGFDFETPMKRIHQEIGVLDVVEPSKEVEDNFKNIMERVTKVRCLDVWKPEDTNALYKFLGDLQGVYASKLTNGGPLLSRIISFCDMRQIMSCFLYVNRSFYDSSMYLVNTMELSKSHCEVLFGDRVSVNETLFLKLLPNLTKRTKSLFLKSAPGRGLYSQIFYFCLIHRFRKAATMYLKNIDHAFRPVRPDLLLVIYYGDSELLYEMINMGVRNNSLIPYDTTMFNRCFVFNRNLDGLKLYKNHYYNNLGFRGDVDLIQLANDRNFIHQIILEKNHQKKNMEILKLLIEIHHFALDKFQTAFFEYLPFIPYEMLMFLITTKPTNMNYFLIPLEVDFVIHGIELSQVMTRKEKKKVVDFIFYYTQPQLPRFNLSKEEDDEEEDEGEDSSDEEEQQEQRKEEGKNLELYFKPETALEGYQFMYFYGREGHLGEFKQALELVDGSKVYSSRFFESKGFSEDFLKLAVDSGKVVTVRPSQMFDPICEKDIKKFDELIHDFKLVKDAMEEDVDELVKLSLKQADNVTFQKLLAIKGYKPGKEPFMFALNRNKNPKDVVIFLGRNFIEGANDQNMSHRVDEMMKALSSCGKVKAYKDLVKQVLVLDNFSAGPQFIVSLEETNSTDLLNTFWRNFKPNTLKDMLDIFNFAIRNKRKDTLSKLMRCERWEESYLVMLRIDPKQGNLQKFGNLFPQKKKRFKVNCFNCGKDLLILDNKIRWNGGYSQCSGCSKDKFSLLKSKLPMDIRELEKIYCRNCTRMRNERLFCTFCVDNM